MDNYEKLGYLLLSAVVIIYLVIMFMGIVVMFPFGLIGLLLVVGLGVLLIKVIKEKQQNKEDGYYSKEIDK